MMMANELVFNCDEMPLSAPTMSPPILCTFSGITGHVRIDDDGDRDADYSILDLDPITGKFEVVAHYLGLQEQVFL